MPLGRAGTNNSDSGWYSGWRHPAKPAPEERVINLLSVALAGFAMSRLCVGLYQKNSNSAFVVDSAMFNVGGGMCDREVWKGTGGTTLIETLVVGWFLWSWLKIRGWGTSIRDMGWLVPNVRSDVNNLKVT